MGVIDFLVYKLALCEPISCLDSIGCCDVPGFQKFSIVSLVGKLL
jgi:hypothetical protein